MARKVKIDNAVLKRYERQEKIRAKNVLAKRRYYLIVCEGTKTEPNYFKALKKELPRGVLTACQIDIEGTGRNTQTLIDEAIQLREEYEGYSARPLDKLWVVFDRDSFDPNDFNNAINRCRELTPEIGCAWSNEAFELWYLLHFHFYNNAISRKDYQALIENNFHDKGLEDYKYQKNSEEMYQLLEKYGSQADALRNAQTLENRYANRNYANHNPCTMVFKLVAELLGLEEKLNNEALQENMQQD